jgi:DNA polymerase I-like protein with 3'-5' exonuclease and polymerase domains
MTMDQIMDELNGVKRINGLSLQACASRLLPQEFHGHKTRFHTLVVERGGKKGKEGAYLHLLTEQELIEYNTLDVIVTLRLYEECRQRLGDYNIDMDHDLYKSSARLISKAKITGIAVDRDLLYTHCEEKQEALNKIASDFKEHYRDQIKSIEEDLTDQAKSKKKTQKGMDATQPIQFNTNSTKQLQKLFVGQLGITPQFLTKTGQPSFSRKFLSQWGEGGEMLKNQKKLLIELKQGEKLLEKSEWDNRWHLDLKATGTKTGRFAGAGGLNIQGLSRGCKSLMSCMVPEDDEVFVSIDLSAGEPTVTTHYSKDDLYFQANFGMVGKIPHYKDKILMIDDIYLMAASASPIASDRMKYYFNEHKWNGKTFAEQWMEDSEVIKGDLKKEIRALHKIWVLGLGYGMGAKKLHQSAIEAGYTNVTIKDARAFHKKYWDLFKGVKQLSTGLATRFDSRGWLDNAFGYRLHPDSSYKAFNYLIQSSVSGIMHVLSKEFMGKNPNAKWVCCIHDELIISCPRSELDSVQKIWDKTVSDLNAALNWTVNIRTGWKVGNNLYEAK